MSSDELQLAEYKAAERRLVRKVDWILMPILTVTLGLQVGHRDAIEKVSLRFWQYYDKAVLGNAAGEWLSNGSKFWADRS
jgi:hypothetical protein